MSRARMTLADIPARLLPEVERQLAGKRTVEAPAPKRLRQRSAPKLNKTEAAFAAWLRARASDLAVIHEQAIKLTLANGTTYTPDFVVAIPTGLATEGDDVTAYEVKGFMRDDASVKLKVAASLYPWIRFVLVSKGTQGREWDFQEVRK